MQLASHSLSLSREIESLSREREPARHMRETRETASLEYSKESSSSESDERGGTQYLSRDGEVSTPISNSKRGKLLHSNSKELSRSPTHRRLERIVEQ